MTPERKEEINRRLRMFENPQMMDMSDAQGRPAYPDYTANLNALVRLAPKLPPYEMRIYYVGQFDGGDDYKVAIRFPTESDRWYESGDTPHTRTEAETEAICQYLEAQDAKSATAKL